MMEQSPTVYVVDDDPDVRESVVELLQTANLTTEAFTNAMEFLNAIDPQAPGCIILDVRMPSMSGVDLRNELLRRRIELPIIFVTGHGDIPMAIDAIKQGAVDFIEKPIRGQHLLDRVLEALKRDRTHKENQDSRKEITSRFARLTPRECEVFHMLVRGDRLKQIAGSLQRSIKTIESHKTSITKKLEAKNRVDLVRIAIKGGLCHV
jgi:two-component system response regulator FixJ